MRYEPLYIDDVHVPKADDDLQYGDEKIKNENETEAGTTMVIVTRDSKLSITGSWTVSGAWAKRFRTWRSADTVKVKAFYPDPDVLLERECQLEISKETHITAAREQIPESGGVYKIDVKITEL